MKTFHTYRNFPLRKIEIKNQRPMIPAAENTENPTSEKKKLSVLSEKNMRLEPIMRAEIMRLKEIR